MDRKDKKKIINRVKNGLVILSVALSSHSLKAQNESDATKDKKQNPVNLNIGNPQEIEFNSDTIVISKESLDKDLGSLPALAAYEEENDIIQVNYVAEVDTTGSESLKEKRDEILHAFNDPLQREANLLHENHHKLQAQIFAPSKISDQALDKKFNKQNPLISLESAAKLFTHKEISATLQEAVFYTLKYLNTNDLDVFPKKFNFVKKAIEDKTITPDFKNKEFKSFLVNGTKKMWLETFETAYRGSLAGQLDVYGQCSPCAPVKGNEKLYKEALKGFYTIGNIDFSEVLQDDISMSWMQKNTIKTLNQRSDDKKIKDYNSRVEKKQKLDKHNKNQKCNMQKITVNYPDLSR